VSRPRLLLAAAAVALLLVGIGAGAGERGRRTSGAWVLLEPVAGALASAQWVRVDAAFAAGDDARGFALAETALALDPGATTGWELLVDHQLRALASPLREPDPERRAAWVRSGLATAERGLGSARAPGDLALDAGIGLLVLLEAEELPAWPGDRAGLEAVAVDWLVRAGDLGSAVGAELARALVERGTGQDAEPERDPGPSQDGG